MMNMTKFKNDYTKENYDKLYVFVPKGRKADVETLAKKEGKTINGLVNSVLADRMGISEDDWKFQKF